jgi:HAD superfamily hydrolase (TIGR01458 family)
MESFIASSAPYPARSWLSGDHSPVPQTKNAEAQTAKAVLLDIEGVICVGDTALPGSLEAVRRIRQAGLAYKFITNTTRRPRRLIVADLERLGLDVREEDVFTPAIAARDTLANQRLTPLLVVHPNLREDFAGLQTAGDAAAGIEGFDAVVVGDAGVYFTYELLNRAYRMLVDGAAFFALARNRNFLDRDGELSLDAGPFVAALEYGSGRTADVLGKPSPSFFSQAVESLGCAAGDVVMIGDDAEADVGGAMAAGLKGVLVRTGKYRQGQETLLAVPPNLVAADLEAAVDRLFDPPPRR